ncbi:MAG: GNAT family N-acetyltransferase [Candidatus Baltobacteraceae bacterium]
MNERLATRRATSADLGEIAPLFDAYRVFFTGESDIAGSAAFLAERLAKQDSVVLAAFDGTAGIGFLQLYPLFSSWYATTIWFLSDLYVADAYRKEGVGKALAREALQFARDAHSRSIMVEIPHSEPHLVTFYESLDFQRDKTFDLYRCYL